MLLSMFIIEMMLLFTIEYIQTDGIPIVGNLYQHLLILISMSMELEILSLQK
jgi:hypothetical protein